MHWYDLQEQFIKNNEDYRLNGYSVSDLLKGCSLSRLVYRRLEELERKTVQTTFLLKEKDILRYIIELSKDPYKKDEDICEEFPYENQLIWNNLSAEVKTFIQREEIEDQWKNFSTDVYFAGYMSPDDKLIEEFTNWLKKRE